MDSTKELFQAEVMHEFEESDEDRMPDVVQNSLSNRKITKEELMVKLSRWYKWAEARERGLEAEYRPVIDQLESEIEYWVSTQKRIKTALQCLLVPGVDADFVNEDVALFYQRSVETVIDDPDSLPLEMIELVPKPKKLAIKAELEQGREVPGARLQENFNLQIKPGGERAKQNSLQRKRAREKLLKEDDGKRKIQLDSSAGADTLGEH